MGLQKRLTEIAIHDRQVATDGGWYVSFCERVADGEPLYGLAKQEGLTYGAFLKWVKSDPDRVQMLQDAQAAAAQKMVDESLEIADNMEPEEAFKAKLRIETRLKIAGKLDQRFGSVPNGVNISGNNIQVVLTQFAPVANVIENEVSDD